MTNILDKYFTNFGQGASDGARDADHYIYITLGFIDLEEKKELLKEINELLKTKTDAQLFDIVNTETREFWMEKRKGAATGFLTHIADITRKIIEAGGDDGGRGSMRGPRS